MDDTIIKVIREFNLKPHSVKKLKYMYICNTDRGLKVLKPTSNIEKSILSIHKLKQHLIYNDFTNIDNYYISNQGTPYYSDGINAYTLTDFNNYPETEFSDLNQVKKIVETISEFHKKGQNFDGSLQLSQKQNLKIKFQDNFKKLEGHKKMCQKQKVMSNLDISFLKNYNFFHSKCAEALDILNSVNCDNINKIALSKSMPSHNNLKEENLIINNSIYLCNFESLSVDHYVYDLSTIILRHLRKQKGCLVNINELLEIYSRYNPLSQDDLKIISAILKFPSRYIDICGDFYNRKRKFTPNIISSRFFDVLEKQSTHYNYIDTLKL